MIHHLDPRVGVAFHPRFPAADDEILDFLLRVPVRGLKGEAVDSDHLEWRGIPRWAGPLFSTAMRVRRGRLPRSQSVTTSRVSRRSS